MSRDEDYAEFDDIECTIDTPKAILVRIEGKEVWIPKVCVSDDSECYKKGTSGKLIITQRIAEEKELV